ncbi:hypothetical protein SDC9_119996 [bioreactor metagenome]|uniref:Uncharacterized protein n=1 Tax=bioreactor metagenome TaxID=1076179 RepID=A0A645C5H9_9ZZZZ
MLDASLAIEEGKVSVDQSKELCVQAQIRENDGSLVGMKLTLVEQYIQQPILLITRSGSLMVEQELSLGFFPEQAMLQGELIVGNLKLGDTIKLKSFIVFPEGFLVIVPKNNAVLVEELL